MKLTTLSLLVLAIVQLRFVSARTSSPKKCFIELSRLLLPRSLYALPCKCEPRVARIILYVDGPPKGLDTVGRGEATLQCIKRQEKKLVELCNQPTTTAFEQQAQPILEKCVQEVQLTEEQAKRNGPYTFDRSRCTSTFKWAPLPAQNLITAGWICECKQTDILEVDPAWARYNITGELGGLGKELATLRTCAESEAAGLLERVCRESPGNYLVLGLQNIQTCCKRARVSAPTKFNCDAIVPTDLSSYKGEI